MVNNNQTKTEEKKNGFNPAMAAVTGAIVGAGVAVAGAIALSDKKNRDNVKEALTNAKDKAVGYMEDIQKQAQDKKDEVEEKLVEGKEKATKAIGSTKASLENGVKETKKEIKAK